MLGSKNFGRYNFVYEVLESGSAVWPNGKALDYESRDFGFDPQLGHLLYNFCNFCHFLALLCMCTSYAPSCLIPAKAYRE